LETTNAQCNIYATATPLEITSAPWGKDPIHYATQDTLSYCGHPSGELLAANIPADQRACPAIPRATNQDECIHDILPLQAILLWNKLPAEAVEAKILDSFKTQLSGVAQL
jgi:hypothetical protein